MNNMLTPEEVKTFLEIDQISLEKLLQQGKIHAYKIGGTYLRFRKEDVLNLQSELRPKRTVPHQKIPLASRLKDFWHFNNFYIVSSVIALVLIVYFMRA